MRGGHDPSRMRQMRTRVDAQVDQVTEGMPQMQESVLEQDEKDGAHQRCDRGEENMITKEENGVLWFDRSGYDRVAHMDGQCNLDGFEGRAREAE